MISIRCPLWWLNVFIYCTVYHSHTVTPRSSKPNIVFILVDDLGWNDISFHGSQQIPTPNIDTLAHSGVILNNYYVSPVCSPTRSAIMTGRHPIHTGLQDNVIHGALPYGLGLNETLLPQYLKQQGYVTHGIGKWHLGFFEKEYTPTYRGFDTFYGFLCGSGDYWDHATRQTYWGLDLRDNLDPVWTQWGNYSTDMFTDVAINRIHNQSREDPMFLYLAYQGVHAATYLNPLQAPPELVRKFSYIKDEPRRKFAAMLTSVDLNIGRIVEALHRTGMYENTVIIFSTDNGGPANGFQRNSASNFPLRGVKTTLWEGGVRGASFVHSPLIKRPGRVSMDLLHITDWLPTLYGLSGGDVNKLKNLDGYDSWNTISTGEKSPRKYVLHNINPRYNSSAIRVGDWKLIVNRYNINWDGWYKPPGFEEIPYRDMNDNAVVKCGLPPENPRNCSNIEKPCLFNIAEDPCEYHEKSEEQPKIVQQLMKLLGKERSTMVERRNKGMVPDPQSNPKLHGGVWGPWRSL